MSRPQNASRQTRELLEVLLAQPRTWRHGYELSQATGLKSGTLYPLLIRLNDQRLLDSKWREPERPGRPPRHVYRLTAGGMALARQMTEEPTESRLSRKSFNMVV
jgi:PadR family transcriptional regulator PadR